MGIDLGTTYSCVTVVKNGEVEVVANDLGRRTVPSWVAFAGDRRLIGQAAKNQASQNPRNTIYDSKRLIGQPFKAVKKDLSFYSFDVKNKGGKPFIGVEFKGKRVKFSPEEIQLDGADADEADRRGLPRRGGQRGRHHRARVLQRRPAPRPRPRARSRA